jgi:peptidoglycan/LPS O-acetylase OafA/YrhL
MSDTVAMKNSKIPVDKTDTKNRILFFDILKIVFIAIIVYDHIQCAMIPWVNEMLFSDGQNFFNIYVNGITGIAVYGMIFVSGAVLEYNHKKIGDFLAYYKFLIKRFIRIYPAFWMSLVLGLAIDILLTLPIAETIIKNNFPRIIFEYTGFYVILGKGPGFINIMGWFIATIVCLYIFFPCLSKLIKKYQLAALFTIMCISFTSRYFLYVNSGMVPDLLWRWFPLCNMFEFCLGIYVMQNNIYPKNSKNHFFIHQVAELSFYVFLFHVIINTVISPYMPTTGTTIVGYLAYFGPMGVILLVCWIAMILDNKIHQKIRQSQKLSVFFI